MAVTQHTCGGPVFGRKSPGCPRCDELLAGAPAVQWRKPYRTSYSRHVCSERCGIVCTFGEW